ncbi:MAG: aminotransferase class III-fold pyridoxal phosphate-dependent enzyme, partial [Planctomycetes bacterium]|nr:aminotransferase class III-fold pyridoxal phosphate-dependent enzyme [Planctomycetota bacterium]
HEKVKAIRHLGTILAIEVDVGKSTSYFNPIRDKIYKFFLDKGLLLRPLGNIIYTVPPYCINENELESIYKAINECLDWIKEEV